MNALDIAAIKQHRLTRYRELDAAYSVAVRAGNYATAREIARRLSRLYPVLVMDGLLESAAQADRDAVAEAKERGDYPYSSIKESERV